MKYLFINSVYGVRSTGKIVADQCHKLKAEGNECVVAYGREGIPDSEIETIKIGTRFDYEFHALMTRCFDMLGLCSKRATKEFLKKVEQYQPDVIWLHNLHGYYINIELLFGWLKKHPQIQVYWTLHDCWAFTGHCAYFTMARCHRWKNGCGKCIQLREYPKTFGFDFSERNYRRKKEAFRGISKMTIVSPSQWLADLTRESFLKRYPVKVWHNDINHEVFKPRKSDFRNRYGLENKYIVLGVAVGWEKTKGYPDMLALREKLSDRYEIVLVGVTEEQIEMIPKGVLGIPRTKNQIQLAEIYSAADVFVNPTHQDNYPTVNLEAAACGIPVVTYDVGGSPESAMKINVVRENDIDGLARRVTAICERKR